MSKEKFDRSKPHTNIGTIGNINHNNTMLTCAILSTLHNDVTLSVPAPVTNGSGGDVVGYIKSLDYSKIENKIMAHISIDTETASLLLEQRHTYISYSGSRAHGKMLKLEMQRAEVVKYFESNPLETLVPVSVYILISNC